MNTSPVPDYDEHLELAVFGSRDDDGIWEWSIDKMILCGRGRAGVEVAHDEGYPDANAALKAGLAVKNALEDAAR